MSTGTVSLERILADLKKKGTPDLSPIPPRLYHLLQMLVQYGKLLRGDYSDCLDSIGNYLMHLIQYAARTGINLDLDSCLCLLAPEPYRLSCNVVHSALSEMSKLHSELLDYELQATIFGTPLPAHLVWDILKRLTGILRVLCEDILPSPFTLFEHLERAWHACCNS